RRTGAPRPRRRRQPAARLPAGPRPGARRRPERVGRGESSKTIADRSHERARRRTAADDLWLERSRVVGVGGNRAAYYTVGGRNVYNDRRSVFDYSPRASDTAASVTAS